MQAVFLRAAEVSNLPVKQKVEEERVGNVFDSHLLRRFINEYTHIPQSITV
jgi:hypothetical protein